MLNPGLPEIRIEHQGLVVVAFGTVGGAGDLITRLGAEGQGVATVVERQDPGAGGQAQGPAVGGAEWAASENHHGAVGGNHGPLGKDMPNPDQVGDRPAADVGIFAGEVDELEKLVFNRIEAAIVV